MIPLLLFLLAIAAVYVGTIETAFTSLMRLSLRLMAERGGRDDRLGFYLEDPTHLFIPARLLLGLIFSFATKTSNIPIDWNPVRPVRIAMNIVANEKIRPSSSRAGMNRCVGSSR